MTQPFCAFGRKALPVGQQAQTRLSGTSSYHQECDGLARSVAHCLCALRTGQRESVMMLEWRWVACLATACTLCRVALAGDPQVCVLEKTFDALDTRFSYHLTASQMQVFSVPLEAVSQLNHSLPISR